MTHPTAEFSEQYQLNFKTSVVIKQDKLITSSSPTPSLLIMCIIFPKLSLKLLGLMISLFPLINSSTSLICIETYHPHLPQSS